MAVTWTKELPGPRLVDGSTVNQLIDSVNGGVSGNAYNGTLGATTPAAATVTTLHATGAATLDTTLNVTGLSTLSTLNVTGVLTTTGGLTVTGSSKVVSASVTATGSTQLGAKAISASFPLTWVIQASTASTKGVRLPAASTGLKIQIANVGAFGVKVYPSTNGKIGGAATNGADSTVLAINKMNTYIARNTTYWVVERGA